MSNDKLTALEKAALDGHREILREFKDKEPAAILYAALEGHKELIEILVEAKTQQEEK